MKRLFREGRKGCRWTAFTFPGQAERKSTQVDHPIKRNRREQVKRRAPSFHNAGGNGRQRSVRERKPRAPVRALPFSPGPTAEGNRQTRKRRGPGKNQSGPDDSPRKASDGRAQLRKKSLSHRCSKLGSGRDILHAPSRPYPFVRTMPLGGRPGESNALQFPLKRDSICANAQQTDTKAHRKNKRML